MKSDKSKAVAPGMTFGRWQVQDTAERTAKGERKWLCRCACGVERYVLERNLKSGGSLSCGCLTKEKAGKALSLNLAGKTFGSLTVLRQAQQRGADGSLRWVCRCVCGNERTYAGSLLNTGRRTHCGCQSTRERTYADISGQTFHCLTALQRLEARDGAGYSLWRCRCACGREVDVSYNALVYGNMKSCGCRKKEHDQALNGYLTHVAGTAVEKLRSTRLPSNNTTGVKGVYLIKGRYVAKIVFQKKQYYLGAFDQLAEAQAARREAEEQINNTVVAYYERWQQRAKTDPAWAAANPVRIDVERDGQNRVRLSFSPVMPDAAGV